MNVSCGVLFFTASLVWGTTGTLGGAAGPAQNALDGPTQDMKPYKSPHDLVNSQAALAKGSDENSLHAVADELFKFPAAYPPVPDSLVTIIKDRLVRAEQSYREGKFVGVQEQDVVNLINTFAKKLNAPEYALTSAGQVRYLRMQLAIAEPEFMGAGMTGAEISSSESVVPKMSPLQAAHLIGFLVTQKFIGEEFQVLPEEWDRTPRPAPFKQVAGAQQGRLTSNLKAAEMRDKFKQLASSLTMQDGLDMVELFFVVLGIPEIGSGR